MWITCVANFSLKKSIFHQKWGDLSEIKIFFRQFCVIATMNDMLRCFSSSPRPSKTNGNVDKSFVAHEIVPQIIPAAPRKLITVSWSYNTTRFFKKYLESDKYWKNFQQQQQKLFPRKFSHQIRSTIRMVWVLFPAVSWHQRKWKISRALHGNSKAMHCIRWWCLIQMHHHAKSRH